MVISVTMLIAVILDMAFTYYVYRLHRQNKQQMIDHAEMLCDLNHDTTILKCDIRAFNPKQQENEFKTITAMVLANKQLTKNLEARIYILESKATKKQPKTKG